MAMDETHIHENHTGMMLEGTRSISSRMAEIKFKFNVLFRSYTD